MKPPSVTSASSVSSKPRVKRGRSSSDDAVQRTVICDFFSFLQCQLRMEARVFMGRDFELEDEAALGIWPTYEKLELRNQGKNEKWVPYHTVLGVHELFVVKEIHHAKVDCWTPQRRFVTMFIFRSHCSRKLFEQVQLPHLAKATFWKDPCAAFMPGGTLHNEILTYRKQGNSLQTNCFLIIPERLLEDLDENLVHNLMLRTQRLIKLAEDLWIMLGDKTLSVGEKYRQTVAQVSSVRMLGETWVKMLMVVIDIALPDLGLLRTRCEVGTGALEGLRQILEDEGVIAADAPDENNEKQEKATVHIDAKGKLAYVTWLGKRQLLQVTGRRAGSLDRAHAICTQAALLANSASISDFDAIKASAEKKKAELFNDRELEVPSLGLDDEPQDPSRQTLLSNDRRRSSSSAGSSASSSSLALSHVVKCINASQTESSDYFWRLLAEVEAAGRKAFAECPLVVAQMRTQHGCLSAVTIQVQLCEWRQFQNYSKHGSAKGSARTSTKLATLQRKPCKRQRQSSEGK